MFLYYLIFILCIQNIDNIDICYIQKNITLCNTNDYFDFFQYLPCIPSNVWDINNNILYLKKDLNINQLNSINSTITLETGILINIYENVTLLDSVINLSSSSLLNTKGCITF
jgi:hypothetical protein